MMLSPTVLTFFVSSKSPDSTIGWIFPTVSFGAAVGSGKTASPEAGSYAAAPTMTFL